MKMRLRSQRILSVAAVAAIGVLALSACAGSVGTGSDGGGDGGEEEAKTLTVITSNDAPFAFTDPEGNLTGIDGELINWIAEKNNWNIEVFTTEFSTMIAALKAGKGDVIVDAMYVTDERKEQVDFTDTWYTQGEGMLVPADSDLTTREEVKGKVVGAQTGTVFQDWITTLEPSETKFFDSQAALIQAVANGQVDAAFTDLAVLAYGLVQNPNDDVKIVEDYEPFFPGTIAAAVTKDNTELLDQLNAGLTELQADPAYIEILEQFGLTEANAVN